MTNMLEATASVKYWIKRKRHYCKTTSPHSHTESVGQKQPSGGVFKKRCSENIQQIALQLYWNYTSAWVFFCNFAASFPNNTPGQRDKIRCVKMWCARHLMTKIDKRNFLLHGAPFTHAPNSDRQTKKFSLITGAKL